MSLNIYHYVDERRLDTLAAQIEQLIITGKRLEPTLSLGFLKVATVNKPLSTDEKVTKLLDYLKKEKLLRHGRTKPSDKSHFTDREARFCLETCHVVRAVIPKNKFSEQASGLGMWISERTEEGNSNLLILLQNFEMDDEAALDATSAYSVLVDLANLGFDLKKASEQSGVGIFGEIEQQRHDIKESMNDPELFLPTTPKHTSFMRTQQVKFAAEQKRELRKLEELAIERERILEERFTSNPVGFLAQLGARIGAQKDVETLYVIRQVGRDENKRDLLVTIGYPIFIRSKS